MKNAGLFICASFAGVFGGEGANPLGTVLELVDELTAKLANDLDAQGRVYHEYKEWCDETSQNTDFAIKTATSQKAKLEAKIGELTSDIEVAGSKIEELAAKTSSAQSELKKATAIREREAADFTESEKELMEAVDALGRAVGVLEKELASNPAAFAQVASTDVAGLLQGLGAVLDAAALSSSDRKKLMSYVQTQQSADDEDDDMGAPAAAAFKSKSGGILDVLQDMKEKADGQLGQLRTSEVTSRHNYEMLKGALTQKAADDESEMEEEKSGRAAASEAKASAEGDLEVTSKELAGGSQELETVRSTCIQVAADREATVAAVKAELEVLAKAKQSLVESTSGAAAASFLQVSASAQSMGSKVVSAVKRVARQQHSAALAQLASRIAAMLRNSGKDDPFTKVRGIIQDMIAKLEKQAHADATEKAYCDEQMAKTEEKKSDLEDDIEKMTSKFDQAAAKSAELKGQVQALESSLAGLAKEQAELDKLRQEGHSEFVVSKADDEKALGGVRKALGLLRDYYGSASASMIQDDAKFSAFMQQPAKPETFSKSSGAGGGIIDILEVCESDIATSLAKLEAEEDDAASEYEKISQENAVTKATTEQDVKYKTQEIKSLKATLAELSADRETANTELSAVNEYYRNIQDRCIAKPESYEERTARRAAEIKGLKEALSILEDETALVQRKRRGSFRGSLAAH